MKNSDHLLHLLPAACSMILALLILRVVLMAGDALRHIAFQLLASVSAG